MWLSKAANEAGEKAKTAGMIALVVSEAGVVAHVHVDAALRRHELQAIADKLMEVAASLLVVA